MPIWHMRVACWVSKAARSHAHAHAYVPGHLRARAHTQKYVMIVAFLTQQWFCERLTVTLYVYCLSFWSLCEFDLCHACRQSIFFSVFSSPQQLHMKSDGIYLFYFVLEMLFSLLLVIGSTSPLKSSFYRLLVSKYNLVCIALITAYHLTAAAVQTTAKLSLRYRFAKAGFRQNTVLSVVVSSLIGIYKLYA